MGGRCPHIYPAVDGAWRLFPSPPYHWHWPVALGKHVSITQLKPSSVRRKELKWPRLIDMVTIRAVDIENADDVVSLASFFVALPHQGGVARSAASMHR